MAESRLQQRPRGLRRPLQVAQPWGRGGTDTFLAAGGTQPVSFVLLSEAAAPSRKRTSCQDPASPPPSPRNSHHGASRPGPLISGSSARQPDGWRPSEVSPKPRVRSGLIEGFLFAAVTEDSAGTGKQSFEFRRGYWSRTKIQKFCQHLFWARPTFSVGVLFSRGDFSASQSNRTALGHFLVASPLRSPGVQGKQAWPPAAAGRFPAQSFLLPGRANHPTKRGPARRMRLPTVLSCSKTLMLGSPPQIFHPSPPS